MGRLFWKFFAILWFAQIATVAGVSAIFWAKHKQEGANPVDSSPSADFLVHCAASTLRFGGTEALRNLLKEAPFPSVFAVDASGSDLLGRRVEGKALERVRDLAARRLPGVEAVRAGSVRYLLYAEHPRDCGPACARFPLRKHRYFPVAPIVSGFFASLIFAALLARYFSSPISNLRRAFESASEGDLAARLGPSMGGRRDELADLGRHYDKMASRLGALMDGQRRLLHDVSHELRSPLARLQAAIGLARQQPERLEETLARIDRECERMDSLVGELLTLSRLEAGEMKGTREIINLDELVSTVVDDARFEAEMSGRMVSSFGVRGLLVEGDAELLHRSLENVVRNAIRHTPEGSRVTIESRPDGNEVRIAVCDQGAGVRDGEEERIFRPFYRGQGSSSGHGLGLAIAQRVVESHGGRIRAFNLADSGLCVEIFLPGYPARESSFLAASAGIGLPK
ncbi:MAG: HAMP domain-containing protein [Burkholderiales bacterium]|nr:HAMP domain-containing protein [Burkholderiales bacterium]